MVFVVGYPERAASGSDPELGLSDNAGKHLPSGYATRHGGVEESRWTAPVHGMAKGAVDGFRWLPDGFVASAGGDNRRGGEI